MNRRWLCGVLFLMLLAFQACAGEGASFETIDAPMENTCATCHDSAKIDALLAEIEALDDAVFTEKDFPDTHFPSGLVSKSVQDMITEAAPAKDAAFDPAMSQRKAWVLHELHELHDLLAEPVPPDYTAQASFDAFATFGDPGAYEGCEIGTKLDLGFQGDPEGMIPLWSPKLFELLGRDLPALSPADRQAIKDYVDQLLPGGLGACGGGGEGSAS